MNRWVTPPGRGFGGSFASLFARIQHLTDSSGPRRDCSIDAVKVSTETGSKNASDIQSQIADLTARLSEASIDLRSASDQSSRLSLNWLTAALVFTALITAGATGIQAWETQRQADSLDGQAVSFASAQPPRPDGSVASGPQQPPDKSK